MRNWLTKLAENHLSIREERGKGLFNAIELVRNRATCEPLVPFGAKAEAAAQMQAIMKFATDSDIWALYPSNRIVAPKVRAMIDFLLERFHPVPPWEAR